MRPSWLQGDVLVDGARLHYYRTGHGGKRALVLVHGFSDNGLCWAPPAGDLESDYDVIMPDMRGHGLSDRARPNEDIDMASDLAGFVRALGLGRPIICGHSMGAMAAFKLGLRSPDSASALVLEDPPWWLKPQAPAAAPGVSLESPIVAWARTLPDRSLEDLLAQYRRDNPSWPDESVNAMSESKKQLDQGIVDGLARAMSLDGSGWQQGVECLSLPTLLITADPGRGAIVSAEAAARARELNPRISVVNIPEAGHLVRFDNYPAFMDSLRHFLGSL